MDEVEAIGKRRLELLRDRHRDMTFDDDYMDTEVGTRGLVRAIDARGEVAGLEFIEPEGVWADPDAVEEYAETMEDGIGVTVIVPDKERLEAEALLREEAGKEIRVLSYKESTDAGWH
jgi:hypothetical protein